jgi:hypothetical protein
MRDWFAVSLMRDWFAVSLMRDWFAVSLMRDFYFSRAKVGVPRYSKNAISSVGKRF